MWAFSRIYKVVTLTNEFPKVVNKFAGFGVDFMTEAFLNRPDRIGLLEGLERLKLFDGKSAGSWHRHRGLDPLTHCCEFGVHVVDNGTVFLLGHGKSSDQ